MAELQACCAPTRDKYIQSAWLKTDEKLSLICRCGVLLLSSNSLKKLAKAPNFFLDL